MNIQFYSVPQWCEPSSKAARPRRGASENVIWTLQPNLALNTWGTPPEAKSLLPLIEHSPAQELQGGACANVPTEFRVTAFGCAKPSPRRGVWITSFRVANLEFYIAPTILKSFQMTGLGNRQSSCRARPAASTLKSSACPWS